MSVKKIAFSEIVSKYKNFFFDCGGVIYNGGNDLPHAYKALQKLKDLNKNVFFVTNASRMTRENMYTRLTKGGFEPDMDKIYTSSYLATEYLRLKHPHIKKVYALGVEALVKELEIGGISALWSKEHSNKHMSVSTFNDLEVDPDIKAVVAGFDFEFNYYKLCYASALIQKGALFVGTNPDANMKMAKYKMPAAGCMIAAIAYASEKEPHIVGKPNPDVIDVATKKFDLNRSECLMVGDSMATDVKLGKSANIDSFLVLTGVTSEENLKLEAEKGNKSLPNYYWDRFEI